MNTNQMNHTALEPSVEQPSGRTSMARQIAAATATRRTNHAGSLRRRGNVYWARWRFQRRTFEQSTGVKVSEPNAVRKAMKRLDELTAPFRLANEINVQTYLALRLKTLKDAALEAQEKTAMLRLDGAYEAFEKSVRRGKVKDVVLRNYRHLLTELAKALGTDTPMCRVTAASAEKYAEKLAQHYSSCSFNNVIRMIAHVWDVLSEQIKSGMPYAVGPMANPWRGIMMKENDVQPRELLTDTEIANIEKVLTEQGDRGKSLLLLFKIGKCTGLRIGDCAKLKWEDIDFANGIVRVKTQKTGAKVSIPLLNELRTALESAESAEQKTGFVIPKFGAAEISTMTNRMSAFFEKAGVQTTIRTENGVRARPYKTFHSLRAQFVTMCAEHGVPLEIVQSVVGHTTQRMTEHYMHIRESAVKEAFAKAGVK